MTRKSKATTFAELLKQPSWSESDARVSREHAVRPGTYNAAGELFDPSGRPMVLEREDVTPGLAQKLVEGGALVAHELCGCGGWTGCPPEWLPLEALARLQLAEAPELVGRRGVPTWIDVCSTDKSEVVYLHGDVRWGDVLR